MKHPKAAVLLALAAVLLGFCLYQEVTHSGSTFVPADLTSEEILAERPELAIQDADKALFQAVLDLPQVQNTLWETRNSNLMQELPTDLGADLPLPPQSQLLELLVTRGEGVSLTLETPDLGRAIYDFTPQGRIHKTIGLYEDGDCRAIYENDNGRVRKLVSRHLWFSWLAPEV